MKGKHNNHARGPASGMYRHGEIQRIAGKRVATQEYRSWQMMKNRCLNPRSCDWDYYGGKGIGIDPRWHDFEEFLADMGRRPQPWLTLERKDGSKDYCKSNCEWATRLVQSRNRVYARLTVAKAAEIRELYKTGNWTQRELAAEFDISQVRVSQIIRGNAWKQEVEQ